MERDSWPQGFGHHSTLLRCHGAMPDSGSTLASMTKWEYATVPLLIHATKQILDTWGQDGWELVQVVPGPNAENMVAYLKRPLEG